VSACTKRSGLCFDKNNDGPGGSHAHLVRSKQDGVGTLPMLLTGGWRRSDTQMADIHHKILTICCYFAAFLYNIRMHRGDMQVIHAIFRDNPGDVPKPSQTWPKQRKAA
jgi:hypothetical protein